MSIALVLFSEIRCSVINQFISQEDSIIPVCVLCSYTPKKVSLLVSICPQSSIEKQVQMLKGGRELASLENLPIPAVPLPPQLAMHLMRSGMFPMMQGRPRAPLPTPGGRMDPSVMMRPHAPVDMGGVASPTSEGSRRSIPISVSPAPFISPHMANSMVSKVVKSYIEVFVD